MSSESIAAHYVAGFVFDEADERVVLIRKNRPAWQAGKLNGVGGRIEDGESSRDAMRREFREETGVVVDRWELCGTLADERGWSIDFYRATIPAALMRDVTSCTDEQVEVMFLEQLSSWIGQAIPNLSWLIPYARYRHDTYAPFHIIEVRP